MAKKIIVVGGGFAGLKFIQSLKKNEYDILLIDKVNHHQFQPLFYQVATSQIEPSNISFPFRKLFSNRADIRIRLAEVLSVNNEVKTIETTIGSFDFDYLVIATGCKTNFFGNKEIEANALTLKTTFQSIQLRNLVLENFEKLLWVSEDKKEALNNIIIVGGGATGVELAGAFAEIKRDILPKDYPRIDFSKLNIILLEGSKHTLNAMSDLAKTASEKYLKELGVQIMTETIVDSYDGEKVTLKTGETIESKIVIWAAGISGNIISGFPENIITKSNRIFVDRTNKVLETNSIYAIGDISYMETPKYAKGHPQVANVAIGQGKLLAKNIAAIETGNKTTEYEYKDLGSMATIGRNKAVVDLPFLKFKGYFAWYIWMFLHLMLILNSRNKLMVFINWTWNYVTKNSSLRLILSEKKN